MKSKYRKILAANNKKPRLTGYPFDTPNIRKALRVDITGETSVSVCGLSMRATKNDDYNMNVNTVKAIFEDGYTAITSVNSFREGNVKHPVLNKKKKPYKYLCFNVSYICGEKESACYLCECQACSPEDDGYKKARTAKNMVEHHKEHLSKQQTKE